MKEFVQRQCYDVSTVARKINLKVLQSMKATPEEMEKILEATEKLQEEMESRPHTSKQSIALSLEDVDLKVSPVSSPKRQV